jgi:epoxyqueuosine reductase
MKDRIRAKAHELGFTACGFVRAADVPDNTGRLQAWLEAGCHGDMAWMEANRDRRAHPQGLWPAVRSVVALGMSYAPAVDPLAHAGEGGVGRISVYARGDDYHDVVKKRLKALARWLVAEVAASTGSGQGCELKVFVDTAPVMEKPLAEAAGIGWQGKHTNLLNRTDGSWLFLGSVFTTLEIEPDAPAQDHCGSCTRCQQACPTAAFPAPYRLDARRCISYLTIEHRGPIPHEFRAAIGNRIYGCDDCLSVCPWNRFADAGSANLAFVGRAELEAPRLAKLLALDDAGFRALFAKSPIKRIGRDRFVRNCLIAAGNSGEAGLAPVVRALTADPDPVVAEAAGWALDRLTKHGAAQTSLSFVPSENEGRMAQRPSITASPPLGTNAFGKSAG